MQSKTILKQLILISIVAVFLVTVDTGFRGTVTELYHKGIGQLHLIDTAFIGLLGVLFAVSVVYLISRKRFS